MRIKAKTKHDRMVTIVAFVVKYNQTYAVVIDPWGKLVDYKLEDLIVVDE